MRLSHLSKSDWNHLSWWFPFNGKSENSISNESKYSHLFFSVLQIIVIGWIFILNEQKLETFDWIQ